MGSFQSFVKTQDSLTLPVWHEMAMGQGSSTLLLEVTQPMANLLSCLPGEYIRARALDWLMFDGMKQAIIGRQKLCDLVNQALQGDLKGGILRPNFPQPANSQRHVVGEARNAFGQGRDPWQPGDPVMPCDLFSPKAHKRMPQLAEVKLEGLSIPEYYDKYLEPKVMIVDSTPGHPVHIDLRYLRDLLESRGMQPFKYGGMDGYLQTVEKGDSLHSVQKQFYDDNDQFGPDLTLDSENGDDESAETLVRGVPTLHLVGGSVNKSENRSANTIKQLQSDFTHIARQLEAGRDITDMDPRVVKQIKSILSVQGLIQKAEINIKEEGAGKGRAAAKMGIPTGVHASEGIWMLPEGFDMSSLNTILQIFKAGLNQPTNSKNLKSIPDPSAFGPEWDGVGPEPDGWHKFQGDKVIIKFSKADQAAIFDYMVTQPLQSEGGLRLRPDWIQIPALAKRVHADSGRFSFSTICNSGEKANPNLAKDFKRVLYSMKGIEPRSFIKEGDFEKIPVQNIDQPGYDSTLAHLWDAGYRWEPQDQSEKQTGHPNWVARDYGILALKSSKFKVVQENGKYFLLLPNGKASKPAAIASHGAAGTASLAGGRFAAGGAGGHVFTKPAGPKTYNALLTMLLNGELGEHGGANSEQELPCIKRAVKEALRDYSSFKHGDAAAINWSNGSDELMSWAVQGLRACSGLPEFQVGFLSQDQIEHVLRWNAERQVKYAEKGWGIDALLDKYGIEDPEDKEEVIQSIIDDMKKNPIIDTSYLTPHQQAAIGENAFEARVRMISGYLLNMMTRETSSKQARAQRGERGESQLAGANTDSGRSGSVLDTGKKVVRNDSEWEAPEELRGRLDPTRLRSKLGINEPEPDMQPAKPIATFPSLTTPVTPPRIARSRTSSNDDSDFEALLGGSKTPPAGVPQPRMKSPAANKPVVAQDDFSMAGMFGVEPAAVSKPVRKPTVISPTPVVPKKQSMEDMLADF